jgi:hypothetical protein
VYCGNKIILVEVLGFRVVHLEVAFRSAVYEASDTVVVDLHALHVCFETLVFQEAQIDAE